MVSPASNPELKRIKFSANVSAPIAQAGVKEVIISVTLSCPAGVSQPEDHPFVRVQRTDGGGRPNGIVTLLEEEQSDQVSELNTPLVVQLSNDAVKSASNIWFFQISLEPLPGNVFFQVFAGYDEAAVRTAAANTQVFASPQALRVAAAGPSTAATPIVQVLTPGPVPRLCVGLNAATPPPLRKSQFSGDASRAARHDVATISKVLAHIAERVRQPLDAAWSQQNGKTLPLDPKFPDTPEGIADANEFWARQVTEMAAFTPYGGPTVSYSTGTNQEFLSDNIKESASNKFYGLTMACENLATFAVSTRGTNPFPRVGLEAGSVSSKITKDAGGKWFIAKAENGAPSATTKPILEEVASPDGSPHTVPGYLTGIPNTVLVEQFGKQEADDAYFGPGSVVLFSNRPVRPHNPAGFNQIVDDASSAGPAACRVEGGIEMCAKRTGDKLEFAGPYRVLSKLEDGKQILADHTAGAHMGAVLRISPDRKMIQTLDTGGLSVAGRDSGNVSILGGGSGFHSGNLDDALTTQVKSVGGEPMRGVGAFARITSSNKADFERQLKALLKARPLGLVRLALMPAGVKVSYKDAMQPASGWLIFLSPLLTMYGKNETENFHITRYLWSLREAPGFDKGVEAWWLFYVPRKRLARLMMDSNDRSSSPSSLLNLAPGNGGSILKELTLPIMNAKVDSSGQVVITNNKFNNQSKDAPHSLRRGQLVRVPIADGSIFLHHRRHSSISLPS